MAARELSPPEKNASERQPRARGHARHHWQPESAVRDNRGSIHFHCKHKRRDAMTKSPVQSNASRDTAAKRSKTPEQSVTFIGTIQALDQEGAPRALPVGTKITVSVRDTSQSDAPSRLLASTSIQATGKGAVSNSY